MPYLCYVIISGFEKKQRDEIQEEIERGLLKHFGIKNFVVRKRLVKTRARLHLKNSIVVIEGVSVMNEKLKNELLSKMKEIGCKPNSILRYYSRNKKEIKVYGWRVNK